MNEDISRLAYLYKQYADGNSTPEERKEFMSLVSSDETAKELNRLIENDIENNYDSHSIPVSKADEIFQLIMQAVEVPEIKNTPVRKIFILKRVAAAAIIFLLVTAGYFYFKPSVHKQIAQTHDSKKVQNDVAPGGNRAVLTLADGSVIILDSAKKGTLTQQGNTKILKLDNGQLAYNTEGSNAKVLYNTITTPRGGQYEIILADGSKVWLNAASSLRFPTSFNGKERNVELSGEGYFEVAKNAAMPFKVKVNEMEVAVLGTHFNINSYTDEAVAKTTLLEGSVKVNIGSISKIIKPGQQAQIENQENHLIPKIMVQAADIDHEVAWKDGLFDFDNDNIRDIMHQLARWYNVEVAYTGKISQHHYTGSIRRAVNISQVLNMLELAGGVQFSIEGAKIILKEK